MQEQEAHRDTAAGYDALVIMAKYPEPGKVKTRLGAALIASGRDDGYELATTLYASFLRDLSARFSAGKDTDGYQLYWACAGIEARQGAMRAALGSAGSLQARAAPHIFAQRGKGLGERLYHACLDMQAAGYRRVVILGSDAPQVSRALVRQAFAALNTHDVALGPALDGGYYLVGMRLSDQLYETPPDIFRPVRMSASTTLDETLACADRLGLMTYLLPSEFDVDELSDALHLAEYLREHGDERAPQTAQTLAGLLPALVPQPV